jgi:hypothetical protein
LLQRGECVADHQFAVEAGFVVDHRSRRPTFQRTSGKLVAVVVRPTQREENIPGALCPTVHAPSGNANRPWRASRTHDCRNLL